MKFNVREHYLILWYDTHAQRTRTHENFSPREVQNKDVLWS